MKNSILNLVVMLTWIPLCLLNANILYVPGNYSTIQSAVNAAVGGDTVLVAPGIYYENVNFRGKGVFLSSYFINNHDTSYISNTIINGSTPLIPDSASCVIMTRSNISYTQDSSATLMGFTITGGHGVVWDDVIYPGYMYREGGGILIQNWSPRIRYNRIIGNSIYDAVHPNGGGGGIHFGNGNPIIENNIIQNNFGYCGMGICIYGAGGIVRNNIIAGNYGGQVYGSGAIYTFSNYQSYPVLIENNIIVNNSVLNGSGGLRLFNSNYNIVKNNIVWGNSQTQIYITQCSPSISFCDIQGGWSGTGNINLNPQFVNNSFYLGSTSPCIDAGDTSASYNDPLDPLHPGLALLPALGTVRNDMGAFGGPHCTVIGSSVIGIKNYGTNQKITDFILSQNYPNPFNPTTSIRYNLPRNSFVKLVVFDAIGRAVESLVNEKQSPGIYVVDWNASQYPSGVYFYRLITGDYSETKKMVLLK